MEDDDECEKDDDDDEGERRGLEPRNILPDLVPEVDQLDTAPWCPVQIERLDAGLISDYAGLQDVGAQSLDGQAGDASAKPMSKRSPATHVVSEDVPSAPEAALEVAAPSGLATAAVATGLPAHSPGQVLPTTQVAAVATAADAQATPAVAAAVPPVHETAGSALLTPSIMSPNRAGLAASSGFAVGTASAAAHNAAAATTRTRQDAAARAASLELPKPVLPGAAVAMAEAAIALSPPPALLPDLQLRMKELKAWETLRKRRDAAQAALIQAFQSSSLRLQQKAMKELHAIATLTAKTPQLPEALLVAFTALRCRQPEAQASPLAVTAVPSGVGDGLGQPASVTAEQSKEIGVDSAPGGAWHGQGRAQQQTHAAAAEVPQAASPLKSLKWSRQASSKPPTARPSKNDEARPVTAAALPVLKCTGQSTRMQATAARAAALPERPQVLTGVFATAQAGAAMWGPLLFSHHSFDTCHPMLAFRCAVAIATSMFLFNDRDIDVIFARADNSAIAIDASPIRLKTRYS